MSAEIVFAELPEIDLLNYKDQVKCMKLLEELDAAEVSMSILKERADEIELELEKIQYKMDTPGLRYGRLAFAAQTVKGRRTLDVTLLMERAGVPKHVIEGCYKAGEPTVRRTFKRLPVKAGGPGEPPWARQGPQDRT